MIEVDWAWGWAQVAERLVAADLRERDLHYKIQTGLKTSLTNGSLLSLLTL